MRQCLFGEGQGESTAFGRGQCSEMLSEKTTETWSRYTGVSNLMPASEDSNNGPSRQGTVVILRSGRARQASPGLLRCCNYTVKFVDFPIRRETMKQGSAKKICIRSQRKIDDEPARVYEFSIAVVQERNLDTRHQAIDSATAALNHA